MGLTRCPYNDLHFPPAHNLNQHARQCPDRHVTSPNITSGQEDRARAIVQMVELKLQCGLLVSQEDLQLYQSYCSKQ